MRHTPGYAVSLQTVPPRTMAAVPARLAIRRVPSVFTEYLNQVYAAARNGDIHVDGQNIFVYRLLTGSDSEADVEFGVGVAQPFATVGNVVSRELPTGVAATTTHWGDYGKLGDAHAAVVEWCRVNGHPLSRTRWEVYGHWNADPALCRTDVFHLIADDAVAR